MITLPTTEEQLIGTVIDGRYRVLSGIGEGGMGVVYKAEHVHLNKLVAVKVMRPTRDSVDRQRFEQEARLASKIRHKNVVEISDFGVLPGGQPYLVMEFLRGHSLGDAIYEGQVDPLLACHIAVQMASGLQAVHKQEVVHRDLKPDNIFLIDPDEQAESDEPPGAQSSDGGEWPVLHFVKIMDFGIAKAGDRNLTGTGMTLGTPEYMSPEQATGMQVDWRSDQYSMGCILYEMLTGELPFQGKGPIAIMQKHLSEPPMPPSQRRPESAIPPELEKIVLCMMMKKPQQRYQSMRKLEQALREVIIKLRQGTTTVVALPPQAKTVVLATGQLDGLVAAASANAQPTAGQRAEAQTRPMLTAIQPDEPKRSSRDAKTVMMASQPTPPPGNTPTPRLLDKLAVRIQGSSLPEIAPPQWWEGVPLLGSLLHRLRTFWQRLFGRR